MNQSSGFYGSTSPSDSHHHHYGVFSDPSVNHFPYSHTSSPFSTLPVQQQEGHKRTHADISSSSSSSPNSSRMELELDEKFPSASSSSSSASASAFSELSFVPEHLREDLEEGSSRTKRMRLTEEHPSSAFEEDTSSLLHLRRLQLASSHERPPMEGQREEKRRRVGPYSVNELDLAEQEQLRGLFPEFKRPVPPPAEEEGIFNSDFDAEIDTDKPCRTLLQMIPTRSMKAKLDPQVLSSSAPLFPGLFDNSAYCVVDFNGTIVECNQGLANLLRVNNVEQLVGKTLLAFIHKQDLPRTYELMQDIVLNSEVKARQQQQQNSPFASRFAPRPTFNTSKIDLENAEVVEFRHRMITATGRIIPVMGRLWVQKTSSGRPRNFACAMCLDPSKVKELEMYASKEGVDLQCPLAITHTSSSPRSPSMNHRRRPSGSDTSFMEF